MPASIITVRLTDEVKEKLETIAKSMDRSRSYLIQQAVEDLIRQYDWQLRDRGRNKRRQRRKVYRA